MPTIAEVEAIALELPMGQRAQLAETLWRSLVEGPAGEIIDEEVQQRRKEMEEDPSCRLTPEEFMAAVRRRIAK